MGIKGHGKSLLVRIIGSPIRALVKARDMYVRSITNCGQSISYGNSTIDGAGGFSSFPRSYSTATSTRSEENEDFAELMRAASARTIESRIDMDLVMKQQQEKQHKGLSKSSSVGMAKIDEDVPFDLSYDGVVSFKPDSYPRSRSYAVTKKSVVF
ncbi:hypothetical protein Lal_00002719 [Lupinus albus]|uniref:Uncharacterized protein n=1 Tax=Lupinus albus TaxID=3870 RepID=A0A6A5N5H3_LUPAL|nr:hypothetical protein Lalb_Chr22g0355731 [Lupinus albus]KAF1882541.1 hypothetical protein Lal_00002719 [Lupinus albus]